MRSKTVALLVVATMLAAGFAGLLQVVPAPAAASAVNEGSLVHAVAAGSAVYDGGSSIFYFGGTADGINPVAEIQRYDIVAQESEILVHAAPSVFSSSAAWQGGMAYIFGGESGAGMRTDSIYEFDSETGCTYITNFPVAISGTCAASDGSSIYIFGGQTGSGVQASIYRFNPADYSLNDMLCTLPAPRTQACAVWTGTYFYIFGGFNDASDLTNSIYRYNPVNNTCYPVREDTASFNTDVPLPYSVARASAVCVNGTVFVYGGFSNQAYAATNSIIKFHPASNMVKIDQDTLPTGVFDCSAVAAGDSAYLLGGNGAVDGIIADIQRHDPVNLYGRQQAYFAADHPDDYALYGSSFVDIGSYSFIAGGMVNPSSPMSLVYRVDPVTMSWMSEGNLLQQNGEGAAVAYTDRMFILGGRGGGGAITDLIQWYRPRDDMSGIHAYLPLPTARADAFVRGDVAYMMGGVTNVGPSSNMVAVNLTSGSVTNYPGFLPYPVYDYTLAYDGVRYAYLLGGTSGGATYYSSVIKMDMADMEAWSLGSVLPIPIRGAAGGYNAEDGLITLIGGESNQAGYNLTSIYLIDPSSGRVDISSVSLPEPIHHAATSDREMLVYGGKVRGLPTQMMVHYTAAATGYDGYGVRSEGIVPRPVAQAATAMYGKDMYVFGGQFHSPVSTIYKVDDGGVVSQMTATLPYGLRSASAATVGPYIYIFGGYSDFFTYPLSYTNVIFRYDPETDSLINTGYGLPSGVVDSVAVSYGGVAYVIGGSTTVGFSSDIYTFNPSSGVTATHSLPRAVDKAVAGVYGGYIYVGGGSMSAGTSRYVQRVSVLNWTSSVVARLPYPSYGAVGGIYDRYLVVVGGLDNTTFHDRFILYDTLTGDSRVSDFSLPLLGIGVVGCAGSEYLLGGYLNWLPNERYNPHLIRIHYEPDDRDYDNCTTDPFALTNPIAKAAAAYDGNAVYLLGGQYSGIPSAMITRYWQGNATDQVLASGCGYVNSDATATYFPGQNRIYLFGGLNGGTYYDYIYYLDLNTLQSYSTGDTLPVQLASSTSHLWRGSILVVGGNIWDGSPRNAVYRYVPGSGSPGIFCWLDVTITQHASVLVGDNLYIFGGRTVGTPEDAIYRYDLVAGHMTRMTSRLPRGLIDLAAVWDPEAERAILMGGQDVSGNRRAEIYAYDPALDILTQTDTPLPVGISDGMAVYDSTLLLGGITPAGSSTQAVTTFRYVPNAPTGSDFVDGDAPGNITLDTNYPHAYSYDLKQTATGQSALNWQIQPNQEYYFEVVAGHTLGYGYIDSVEIQGWFDQGSDASTYNGTQGGTANFHFTYENSTATSNMPVAEMLWPGNGELSGFSFQESNLAPGDPVRSQRKILRFRFTPSYFMRWANGVGGGTNAPDLGDCWDDLTAFNDPDSWNFEIDVSDGTGNTNTTYDEFGVFKYQQIVVQHGDPYLAAAPGTPQTQMTTTGAGDQSFVYTRMNAPFRLSANVTDLSGPDTIAATNMYIDGGSLAGITQFPGAGYANRVYYKGLSGNYVVHQNASFGSWYESALEWFIAVPAGIAEGQYDGYITYRSETASDASQAALPANAPPASPTSHTPSSGSTVVGTSVTLAVSVADPSRAEEWASLFSNGGDGPESSTVLVTFMNAQSGTPIWQGNVPTGGSASCVWSGLPDGTYDWYAILDDGEYVTVSPTWSFDFDYNNQPDLPWGPSPSDGATFSGANAELMCWISDPDGDTMWATIYDGNDNPLEGYGPLPSNSIISHVFTPPNGVNSWYVVVSDGKQIRTGAVWSYTYTFINYAPNEPSDPVPAHFATVAGPDITLQCTMSDPNGGTVYADFFGRHSSEGSYNYIGSTNGPSGSVASMFWNCGLTGTYYWYVTLSDGSLTTNGPTWTFDINLINHSPNAPGNPSPTNGGTVTGMSVMLQCYVYDEDNDFLTVRFYEAGGSMICELMDIMSDSYPSYSWTVTFGYHEWYAVVTDEHGATISGPIWSFTNLS